MSGLAGLDHHLRPAAGAPEGALVLLHGRGTSEHDLLPLLKVLDPQRRLVGLLPGGPLSLPPGGRHWYRPLAVGRPEPVSFHSTFATLCAWLDAVPGELGISIDHTVLGGFSQGTVMSYALGLAARRPAPAGILALSGFLPEVPGLELDPAGRGALPVAIAHGAGDPIIGVQWGRQARDALAAAGLDVSYSESPAGHSVDPRSLPALGDWVRRTLAAAAGRS